MTFTAVFSAGRFDRSVKQLSDEVNDHHNLCSLAVRTELSNDERIVAFRLPGWSFTRGEGRGADECLVEWDNADWSLCGMPTALPLTDRTWTRSKEYGGGEAPSPHVLRVPLARAEHPERRVTVFAAHMPLDNTPLRADIWIDCAKELRRLVRRERERDPYARTLIGCDWNKNYREAHERAMIQDYVAHPLELVQAWRGHVPEHGGTHGPRGLIDGFVTDLSVLDARLLDDTPASDHQPFAVRLDW